MIVDFTSRNKAKLVLILVLLISCFWGYRASLLQFNHDFESFFPQKDADADFYKEFRKVYGSENNFGFIVIEDEKVYSNEFLTKITQLTAELKALGAFTKIIGPDDLKQIKINGLSFTEEKLINSSSDSSLKACQNYISKSPEWFGSFFGKNNKSVLIYLEYNQDLKGVIAYELLDQVNAIIEKYKFKAVYKSGRIEAEKVFVEKMQEELILFISLSIVLLICFLWIAYKSFWGVWVPLTAVLISIIWTCGIMQLTGYKIDVVSVLIPSILFIITISDITHFLSKYIEELRNGTEKITAFKIAYKEIGLATFITAVTTSVGFFTFINAQMVPIKYFGIYSAIGVFVSYFIAFTYMPALMVLLPAPKISKLTHDELFWNKKLHTLFAWVIHKHRLIFWSSVMICLVGLWSITKIKINGTIMDDISDKDDLKKSLKYIEDNFGGVRTFEMDIVLSPQSEPVWSLETFNEIQKLQDFLETQYGVTQILSPVSMVKLIHKSRHNLDNNYFKISESPDSLLVDLKLLKKSMINKQVRNFIKEKGYRIRISGRIKDYGSLIFREKNAQLEQFIGSQIIPNLNFTYHVTGTAPLIDKNNYTISIDMIWDLIIGVLTIGIIVGLLFKNIKMALLAIIPNFAPLILIAAFMAWMGMDLKASNSIIFSIAFGIAIDDSIHFLSRFKEEITHGKSMLYALKSTYLSTGKAMLVTSLIVISGFCTMIFSDFGGTFYMGLLVSMTLVLAIIFDFLLMPALLIMFYKPK